MKAKFLSIIIPVYNAEKYIGNILKKLDKQANNEIEIILVDDGSKDSSFEICTAFADKNDCFVAFHQENQGASAARNKGIDLSSGNYIVFVDSDDDVSDNFIEIICDLCRRASADIIQLDWYNETDGESVCQRMELPTGKISVDTYSEFVLSQISNPPWNKVYNADIVRKHGIYFDTDLVMGEDVVFTLKFMEYVKNVFAAHESVYHYRRNEYGLCENTTVAYFDDLDKIFHRMRDFICLKKLDNEANGIMMQSMLRSFFRAIGLCMRNGYSRREIKQKLNCIESVKEMKNASYKNSADVLRKKLMMHSCFFTISCLVYLKNRY